MSSLTSIQEFYKDKTIFLTGFTGFLGQAIFEKLLRSCSDLKKVYLLMRPKKGLDAKQRLEKLINNEFFDRLKQERPDFLSCISIMDGDLLEEKLGLSEKDINILLNEVNIVIHSAATVKLNDKLKIAVKINLYSTKYILDLIQKCNNLKSFVHISTAYSNCYLQDINEQFYTPKADPWEIIEKVNKTDEEILESLTQELIGEFPNTYTFTKNLAEHVVKTQGKGFPVCVVRPSIILGSNEEPHRGWTGSNVTGPFGIMAGSGSGLIRVLNVGTNETADFVPVDMVANTVLAAAYHTAEKNKQNNIEIYNIVTGKSNPVTWGEYMTYSSRAAYTCPFNKSFWTQMTFCTKCAYWHKILQFILHIVPGYILDFLYKIMGKKPFFINMYKKLHAGSNVISHFLTRSWNFNDENTRKLFFSLSENDQKIFNFDVKKIEWDMYYLYLVRGLRKEVIRDPISNVPEAITQLKWRSLINIALLALLVHFTFSTAGVIIIGSMLTYVMMCSY